MKLMHIADLHLGCRMYGIQQREEDFYDALKRVGDIAKNEHVDVVVVAGDVFDTSKPSARAVYEMSSFCRDLYREGIEVVGIEGNHDLTGDSYWLRVCGMYPLSTAPYENSMSGVRIAGLNWCRSEQLITELEKLADECEGSGSKRPVVVLHCGFAEMGAGFNPDLSAGQIAPLLKRIGCTYCAAGHIHIPMEQRHDGIWFVQPGSLEMKSVDEPQTKSVEIVEIDDGTGEVKDMRSVPYQTRQIKFFNVNTEEELSSLCAAAADAKTAESLCVFYVNNAIDNGVSRVSEWAKDRGFMFRVLPVGAKADAQREYDRSNSMNLLKDAVEAYFREGSDQHRLVLDILATGNPRLIVEKYLDENSGAINNNNN